MLPLKLYQHYMDFFIRLNVSAILRTMNFGKATDRTCETNRSAQTQMLD